MGFTNNSEYLRKTTFQEIIISFWCFSGLIYNVKIVEGYRNLITEISGQYRQTAIAYLKSQAPSRKSYFWTNCLWFPVISMILMWPSLISFQFSVIYPFIHVVFNCVLEWLSLFLTKHLIFDCHCWKLLSFYFTFFSESSLEAIQIMSYNVLVFDSTREPWWGQRTRRFIQLWHGYQTEHGRQCWQEVTLAMCHNNLHCCNSFLCHKSCKAVRKCPQWASSSHTPTTAAAATTVSSQTLAISSATTGGTTTTEASTWRNIVWQGRTWGTSTWRTCGNYWVHIWSDFKKRQTFWGLEFLLGKIFPCAENKVELKVR